MGTGKSYIEEHTHNRNISKHIGLAEKSDYLRNGYHLTTIARLVELLVGFAVADDMQQTCRTLWAQCHSSTASCAAPHLDFEPGGVVELEVPKMRPDEFRSAQILFGHLSIELSEVEMVQMFELNEELKRVLALALATRLKEQYRISLLPCVCAKMLA